MAPPRQITQWLKQTYPKPQVDSEWLDACYAWIIEEFKLNPAKDIDKIIENVESQLLQSDLRDSMVHGTGLPANISALDNTSLHGPPVLVEIISMTEVGHSAFTLQNTRQTRIDASDLAVLAADDTGEDDGPVPNYPRAMLRFELSDGSVTFQAMEYRTLPEIQLGVTPLGYKMLLKDVFIRRGIGFLEPKCVVMKGHRTADREALQDSDFVRGLRARLGQPEVDPENDPPAALPALTAPLAPANPRSPLRELSEPPPSATTRQASRTAHEDENQPRRRRVPNPPPPPPRPTGSSIFFANQSDIADLQDISTDRASILSRERWCSPTRTNTNDTVLEEHSSSEFGDDNIVVDDEFLEQVNQAEMEAMGDTAGRNLRQPMGGSSSASSSATAITIEDDDEDDKENVPVPTRNVRRRTFEVIDISD